MLIGATTENPSFEVNAALLSRSKVFVLKPLDEDAIAPPASPRAGRRRARLGREEPLVGDDALAAIARYRQR